MSQKHLCEACRERKARFQYRGVVKADRAHTLCFACFRSERDRLRARGLATSAPPDGSQAGDREPTMTPLCASGTESMTPAQRAHRFRMLAHLTRAGARRRLP
jgi:hypothetical protein